MDVITLHLTGQHYWGYFHATNAGLQSLCKRPLGNQHLLLETINNKNNNTL